MESGGHIETIPKLAQPDLLEAYADHEVTVFGMTGTLRDLADKCPVDLNSESITTEMKNDFVVKVANEAGIEIEPSHATLFTEIADKHGLEQNFRVKQPVEIAKPKIEPLTQVIVEVPVPVSSNPIIDTYTARVMQLHVESAHVDKAVEREAPSPMIELPIATLPIQIIEEIQRSETPAIETDEPAVHAVKVNEQVSQNSFHEVSVEASAVYQFEAESESSESSVGEIAPDQTTFIVEPSAIEGVPPILTSLERPETFPTVEAMWEEELWKDNGEVYQDFTEALRLFEDTFLPVESDDEDTAISPLEVGLEIPRVPEIVGLVANHLEMLETNEQAETAQILKNIVGAVHGLKILEARESNAEVTQVVEDKLREYCRELFDALGIEYDENDIEDFMGVLLHRDFQFAPKAEAKADDVDLEHTGTREAKLSLHATGGQNIPAHFKQMLGRFAVLQHILLMTVSV